MRGGKLWVNKKWFIYIYHIICSVQFSWVAQSCLTLCDPMNRSTPGLPVHHQLLEFTQSIESVTPSSHLILCRPLSFLLPIPPSIRVFSKSQLFAWGGQSTGVSALASFPPKKSQGWSPLGWTGWLSLQSKGLSNSLLQHHSSKALILWCSAFFTVQLSHPYMTTGKTITLTRLTFVGKVMSLQAFSKHLIYKKYGWQKKK